jgi:hypothetical protein
MNRQTLTLTAKEPWLNKDYPKLAAWLDERKDLISKLLEISKLKKCRLPIPLDRQQVSHSSNPCRHMDGWTHLLVRCANNDAAEGRRDAAIAKYLCVLQMSDHLGQQPVLSYFNNGLAQELLALNAMNTFVAKTDLTDHQLRVLEAALPPADDNWRNHSRKMVRVQRLLGQQGRPPLTNWRRYWEHRKLARKIDAGAFENTHNLYLINLLQRRRAYILIALRRYKNKTGQWPRSLDLIEPQFSEETLTDPRSDGPFVYEVTSEGFKLHSESLTER